MNSNDDSKTEVVSKKNQQKSKKTLGNSIATCLIKVAFEIKFNYFFFVGDVKNEDVEDGSNTESESIEEKYTKKNQKKNKSKSK